MIDLTLNSHKEKEIETVHEMIFAQIPSIIRLLWARDSDFAGRERGADKRFGAYVVSVIDSPGNDCWSEAKKAFNANYKSRVTHMR